MTGAHFYLMEHIGGMIWFSEDVLGLENEVFSHVDQRIEDRSVKILLESFCQGTIQGNKEDRYRDYDLFPRKIP